MPPYQRRMNPAIKGIKRVLIKAPETICIYYDEYKEDTFDFFDQIVRVILIERSYIEIDLRSTKQITAAAALILFAQITRCQNCAPVESFKFRDQVASFKMPTDKAFRNLFIKCYLWESIKPGGSGKIERLWKSPDIPFKTGNNPSYLLKDMISWLKSQQDPLPDKLVSAIQEAYLNITHHAYTDFNTPDSSIHEFMKNRWWQYCFFRNGPATKEFVFLIYDMGKGIPYHVKKNIGHRSLKDNECIEKAMVAGYSSTGIPGRGKGSENLKKPITVKQNNDSLLVLSSKGYVNFINNSLGKTGNGNNTIGGTLIEWSLEI